MTITVDNDYSNDAALGHIKNYLREANKSIMGNECLHIRCDAHILNLIMVNGLKDLLDLVASIRTALRFVRSLPARLDKFNVALRVVGIEYKKGSYFDVFKR